MKNLSETQQIWLVIPASGIGARMQSSVPKQYLKIQQKTVIEATLDRILSLQAVCGAVVVISENDDHWKGLNYQHDKPVLITTGAKERSGSVLNGLKKLQDFSQESDLWVMIHDAVRPCVTHADLQQLVDASSAEKNGLFLAHPVADTLKKSDENQCSIATVNRDQLWRAFTPQMFPYALIFKALKHAVDNKLAITDDVSAVEALGLAPKIILGQSDNIKITYPQDILIAELVLQNQKNH